MTRTDAQRKAPGHSGELREHPGDSIKGHHSVWRNVLFLFSKSSSSRSLVRRASCLHMLLQEAYWQSRSFILEPRDLFIISRFFDSDSLRTPPRRVFLEVPSHRHGALTHWPLVIPFNFQPPSPPWTLGGLWEQSRVGNPIAWLDPQATSPPS